MVWPWKRAEVIDMTKMKLPRSSMSENVEIVDLSSNKNQDSSDVDNSLNVAPNMDFLGGLAGVEINKESEILQSSRPVTDRLREARKSKLKIAFNEMKLKIEDTDYKLNDILGKVRAVERRLADLERR